MKFAVISVLVATTMLFSCKHGKKDMITGSWQGVKLENADMDSFFTQSQKYIDTLGKNGNDMTNYELYGVTNVDSLRKILQLQQDSVKSMQKNGVVHTVFNFKKDSIAEISFNGIKDTSKWYLESDKDLVLEELTGAEKGTKTKMGIIALTDNELILKFEQEGSFSTVTFAKQQK